MTPSALTAEEMAEVASIITGKVWIAFHERFVTHLGEWWEPSLSGSADDGKRSQALAVVEWLFAWLLNPECVDPIQQYKFRSLTIRIGHAIRDKDTTALCRMVLELKEQA